MKKNESSAEPEFAGEFWITNRTEGIAKFILEPFAYEYPFGTNSILRLELWRTPGRTIELEVRDDALVVWADAVRVYREGVEVRPFET